jgi:hypothetical protein
MFFGVSIMGVWDWLELDKYGSPGIEATGADVICICDDEDIVGGRDHKDHILQVPYFHIADPLNALP